MNKFRLNRTSFKNEVEFYKVIKVYVDKFNNLDRTNFSLETINEIRQGLDEDIPIFMPIPFISSIEQEILRFEKLLEMVISDFE